MPQLFLVDCGGGDLLLSGTKLIGTKSGARELPSVKRGDAHFASSAVRELPIPPVCHTLGCGQGYCSRRESGGLGEKQAPCPPCILSDPWRDRVALPPSAVFRPRTLAVLRVSAASAVKLRLSDADDHGALRAPVDRNAISGGRVNCLPSILLD